MRVAASEAGDIVLVMDKNMVLNSLMSVPFVKDFHSDQSNDSFDVIRNELANHKISVTRVEPLGFLTSVDGYYLFLDGDGYSILKKYSK